METHLITFLDDLLDYKAKLAITRDIEPLSSEFQQMSTGLKRLELEKVSNIFEGWIVSKILEINHPINQTVTHAFYSVRLDMANFIFFCDSEGQNIWILCQSVSAVDIIVTDNCITHISSFDGHTIFCHLDKLKNIVLKSKSGTNTEDFLSAKELFLLLEQTRPYHFFYDQLIYYYHLRNNGNVFDNEAFFRVSTQNHTDRRDKVFIFPIIIGMNFFQNDTSINTLREQMEKNIRETVLAENRPLLNKDRAHDLVIWHGVTGEKRRWIEQEEACFKIVLELKKYVNSIKIIIDGMTAKEGQNIVQQEETYIYERLKLKFSKFNNVSIDSIIGLDYRQKISICNDIDLFIANGGTGCMVPLRFMKKPGVVHHSPKMFTFPDNYPETVKFNAIELTNDVYEGEQKRADYCSYHIPWQHIFNLIADILASTKGLNIDMLKVPPLQDLIQRYKNKILNKDSNSEDVEEFTNIKNKLKNDFDSADVLREVAFSFEKVGDIETALSVMQRALEQRPTGPVIKRKIEEYKKILGYPS